MIVSLNIIQPTGGGFCMYDINTSIFKMQAKKQEGLILAESYDRLAVLPSQFYVPSHAGLKSHAFASRASKLRGCGTYLKFGLLGDGNGTLMDANFCRQRLCPACNYRRSLKVYSSICKVLDWVDATDDDHAYFFLTLTVRNVRGSDLGDCIGMMAKGWNRLISRRSVKHLIKGTVRTVEVTYNKATGTYHPHYHVILGLPKLYGSRQFDIYWDVGAWADAWQSACRLPYSPSVSIRRVRGLSRGIKETAKYSVKPADWLNASRHDIDSRVYYLTVGLHGKRLLSFSGLMREAKSALKINDEEEICLTDEITRNDVLTAVYVYRWNFGASLYQINIDDSWVN